MRISLVNSFSLVIAKEERADIFTTDSGLRDAGTDFGVRISFLPKEIFDMKILDEIKRNQINWEEKENKKINFFTIDLKNRNLIHRDELIPKIKHLYDKLNL
ncbi:MAG: hypothetical protein OIN87_06490 [Candidatus Methanoperedens sp.]|nr:hypothetical protein [Candidatus Methanoperedens sp.]